MVAGVVSTVASVASLVSYPALLAIGLPPLTANVTNTVALAFTGVGATVGSRPELAHQSRLVLRLAVVTACGGATGAAVLLLTPARTFEVVAPGLIAFSALVILFQPKVSGISAVSGHARDRLLTGGVFAVSIYTGYFGAAGGILMLAVLTAKLSQSLVRVNAVKNVISGVANAVAAIAFALFGPVRWAAAVPLALGFLVGGWAGPWLVRRIPAAALKVIIAVLGLLVAAKLAVSAYL